jgi:HD-GYP domain-containing protein (c-di-GMP phosphodiesterase class II)
VSDKANFLNMIIDKGGVLAIDERQKLTFLRALDLKEEDVPSLQEPELTELEKEQVENEKILALKREEDGEYNFQAGLAQCLKDDNFLPMILSVKEEAQAFSMRISPTVSLSRHMAKELLIEDNFVNRIVALSFYLTKNCDMKDSTTLADVICSGFFCHLGHTQMDFHLSHKAHLEFTYEEEKKYKKHPGLSQHILNKSKVDLSARCKVIISSHHERYDGSGYPTNRMGSHIDILALIIGAVSHILEFSEGKVTGTPRPIKSVLRLMKNKVFTAGLEFEYGDTIYENIINILSENELESEDESDEEINTENNETVNTQIAA